MKGLPNRLLFRTALLFALLLIVSQIAWVSVSAGMFLRPIRMEYLTRLAADVKVTRSAILTIPPQERAAFIERLGRESGFRIVVSDAPAKSLTMSQHKFPATLAQVMKSLAGPDVDVRTDPQEKAIWTRFEADGVPYWLVFPSAHVPHAFPVEVLIFATIAVLAAITGAYLIVSRLNRRLRAVVEAARAIGRGEVPARLPVRGPEEIQELSRGFNQMSEGLQRLESDRRLMLAGISHDLRTPLARLRLGVELSSGSLKPGRVSSMVQDINEMDAILRQFLDFARNESDEAPELCDFNAIVADVCGRYQLSGQEVRTALEPLEPVSLRKLAIRRLITNLIDNGLCYGERDVEVTTSRSEAQIVLTVADRGPGVQSGNPDDLIRPFAREDSSRSKPGSGLGLTVVDRIARAHGGSLKLLNRPGGGLLARVTLSATQAASA